MTRLWRTLPALFAAAAFAQAGPVLAAQDTVESSAGALAGPNEPVVRLVYLVPADRPVRAKYVRELRTAVRHLQIWYQQALGEGRSFALRAPIVEVVRLPNTASWYSTNPAGNFTLWFWHNVLADAFPLTGGQFFDSLNTWIYYIDADPACGQAVGGTSGVALMPANDLRGLAAEPNRPLCLFELPDTAGRCRWVGGFGHELGHAFGLPHPPACEDLDEATACPDTAVMWLGYISYPRAFFTAEDRLILGQSPFFSPRKLPATLPACE